MRTWKCPECGHTEEISHARLADHGGPVCSQCDCDMELQTKTTTLTVEIEYDPAKTAPDGLACAMDRLLKTALSTPGVVDDCGNPRVGAFLVWPGPYGHAWGVFYDAIRKLHPDVFATLAEAQAVCEEIGTPEIAYTVEIVGCPTHEPDEAEECTIDEE